MTNEGRCIRLDAIDSQIESLVKYVYNISDLENVSKFTMDKEVRNIIDGIDDEIRRCLYDMTFSILGIRYRDLDIISGDVELMRQYSKIMIEKLLLMMAVCDKYKNNK